ncbi:MAG: glycosyl hydrolase family 18 protein [Lachnospiraceae bacterium]|nr:glycosyl hydrolase family 18 protein [Lachnospiraceae bacterium]
MKKRIITILVPVVLIILVAAAAIGSMLYGRFSYSKERADMDSYFGITQADDTAIVMQDEIVEEMAKYADGLCYFTLSTVEKYFTDRFYVNSDELVLLFTTDTDVVKINIGEGSNLMYISDVPEELGYRAAFYDGDVLYIAADYVQKFSNLEYYLYDEPLHVQVYTQWDEYTYATLSKKTAVRYQGGRKSAVLQELAAGDHVTILEKMENWTKVKTADSIIGYVENKFLTDESVAQRVCNTGFEELVYHNVEKEGTINLTFHQVFEEVDGNYLANALSASKSVNVVSPTWFRLSDSSGSFTSLANASYVNKAHELGIEVWALVTDVDSEDLFGVSIDFVELLSSSANRRTLIDGLMAQVDAYGLDGINIDFEKVKNPAGTHFVQFLRELSIETRKRGVVLSVDNFVPSEYTAHYNRKEQGIVVDYVIIMGYDEHYVGGGVAGSNASIDFVENGIVNTKESVPAEKIINAIPFYTRVWASGPDGLTASTLTMSSQQDWIERTGVTPVWMDEYCQNYAEYQSGDTVYQCWLEDVSSIQVKLQVMQSQGIKGVASWKLGIEDPAVWDVISAYVTQ